MSLGRRVISLREVLQRILSVAILLVPFFLFGWIVDQNYISSGRRTVTVRPDDMPKYISNISWQDGVTGTDDGGVRYALLASSFGFDVRLPRAFTKVTMDVTYQNPYGQREVNLLAEGDEHETRLWSPILRYHPAIEEIVRAQSGDNADSPWHTLRQGNYLLLQRGEAPYATINDFITNPPAQSEYRTQWLDTVQFLQFNVPSGKTELRVPLQGSHAMRLYTHPGDLHIGIEYYELNGTSDPNTFKARLTDAAGTVLDSLSLSDDGVADASGRPSAVQTVELNARGITGGMYGLTITTTNDVIIHSVETEDAVVLFDQRVSLAADLVPSELSDREREPKVLYATSRDVEVRANRETQVQTVRTRRRDTTIDVLGHFVPIKQYQPGTPIEFERDAMVIRSRGFLSLTPMPVEGVYFDGSSDLPYQADIPEDIDYVLALYPESTAQDTWQTRRVTYEGNDVVRGLGRAFHVQIVSPRIEASRTFLKLAAVTLTFEKPPLTAQRVLQKIRSLLP